MERQKCLSRVTIMLRRQAIYWNRILWRALSGPALPPDLQNAIGTRIPLSTANLKPLVAFFSKKKYFVDPILFLTFFLNPDPYFLFDFVNTSNFLQFLKFTGT
jgi:hypothetical protein